MNDAFETLEHTVKLIDLINIATHPLKQHLTKLQAQVEKSFLLVIQIIRRFGKNVNEILIQNFLCTKYNQAAFDRLA